ncbi:MAG: hypothetical protein ACE5KH_06445, partial [Candidatus Geothermarchaeales archaeon]
SVIMHKMAERFYYMYYAAKARNWRLARHFYGGMLHALHTADVTRPKWSEPLAEFEEEYLKPVLEVIRAQNWEEFEENFRRATEGHHRYHQRFGYGHIRFKLPDVPPPFFDMEAEG